MLKHIITKECNRNCSYCISKNITQKQNISLEDLFIIYKLFSKSDNNIMLTGGEPTLAFHFKQIAMTANVFFKGVFLTTQDPDIFDNTSLKFLFSAITFSIHDRSYKDV